MFNGMVVLGLIIGLVVGALAVKYFDKKYDK